MSPELSVGAHPLRCLMMRGAARSANSSPALQKALAEKRSGAREKLRLRIKQGIEEGDVPADADAGALADFYSTIIMGMSMQAREGATRKSLLATVERAMSLFPASAKKRAHADTRKTRQLAATAA